MTTRVARVLSGATRRKRTRSQKRLRTRTIRTYRTLLGLIEGVQPTTACYQLIEERVEKIESSKGVVEREPGNQSNVTAANVAPLSPLQRPQDEAQRR